MNNSLKAHLALFAVALLYGGNYTVAKEVMTNGFIQPLGFILVRAISATIFFSCFHFIWIKEKVDRKDFKLLILCGLFGVAINQMFFFSGLKLSSQINAALIMTITPIIVLITSALLIGEKITSQKVIGILIGASGAILLIAFNKQISFNKSGLLGDLLLLVNAASYAIYIVLVKTLLEKYHPVTVVRWVFTIGLVFIIPFGWKQLSVVEWSSFPSNIWLAVFYVVVGATFLTYLLNTYALGKLNPSTVSIYIYLQPLLATIIALAFGKDHLDWVKIVSGILIFLGVFLVSVEKKKISQ